MSPSGMLSEWENPFKGFSVHISDQDVLTVYASWLCGLPGGSSDCDPRVLGGASELKEVIESHERFQLGNPLGVLVTSAKGGASNVLPEVVDELFIPSIQVYYRRTPNKPMQTDGPSRRR